IDTTSEGYEQLLFPSHWFRQRLIEVKKEISSLYKEFKLSEALKTIYSLIWDDFCSWYLEWVKPGYGQPILDQLYNDTIQFFEELLQLLHPFMPFVTEEMYHQLKERENGDDLVIKQFIKAEDDVFINSKLDSATILKLGQKAKIAITAIRDIRNKSGLKLKDNIKLHIQTDAQAEYKIIESILASQLAANEIIYVSSEVADTIAVVVNKDKFYVETGKEQDTAAQKERLLKDLDYLKGFLISVDKKLSNERFVQNAKPEVVDVERRKKQDAEDKIKIIEESLSSMI
ncbi:MAG TPA: class I tRNA ligase family protein, partial [Chitinophagaceae bacterium]|nr:class I tRNA ligase family protein [Chitinophagaceae bacterium]